MKYKILAILEVIKLIIIPLIVFNVILYLIFSFLFQDLNILNWWFFNSIIGRFATVLIEILIIVNTPKFWEAFE